jgi:hypothetical protein
VPLARRSPSGQEKPEGLPIATGYSTLQLSRIYLNPISARHAAL